MSNVVNLQAVNYDVLVLPFALGSLGQIVIAKKPLEIIKCNNLYISKPQHYRARDQA